MVKETLNLIQRQTKLYARFDEPMTGKLEGSKAGFET